MTLDTAALADLAAIRERDAALHYCATCGNRVYDLADEDDPHSVTVEECDARLAKSPARKLDPETGHLCWTPADHRPFVEGPIPDYEDAQGDRRALLSEIETLRKVREAAAALADHYDSKGLDGSKAYIVWAGLNEALAEARAALISEEGSR